MTSATSLDDLYKEDSSNLGLFLRYWQIGIFIIISIYIRNWQNAPLCTVSPSRIPHRISKIIFALGADEFLAILEGKLERPHFFKVQSGKITVWCPLEG